MAFLTNTPVQTRQKARLRNVSPRLAPSMIRAPPRTPARAPAAPATTTQVGTVGRGAATVSPAAAPVVPAVERQAAPYATPGEEVRVFPVEVKPKRRSKLGARRPAAPQADRVGRGQRVRQDYYKDQPNGVDGAYVGRKVADVQVGKEDEEDSDVEDPDEDEILDAAGEAEEDSAQRKPKGVAEDSIRSYLHEIGEVKLLNAEKEVNLAREIAKLLELERVSVRVKESWGREPRIEEWAREAGMELGVFRETLRRGLKAKEHMVAANLRLVVSIAKKYVNRGLSFQDLIQEGSMGLIRGAEKFDGNKGFKFSTYATWWIRQAITRAIADHSRPIRLPVHVNDTIAGIRKVTKILHAELDRPPSEDEIAEKMGLTVEKLRFMARSSRSTISLETPVRNEGKDSSATLGSFIMWEGDTPEDHAIKSLLREDLENVLNTLSPRERDVVRMRYGFDDGRMKTLEEIGSLFAVTRERIRQIEAKALRKLRHPNRNAVLREYVYEDA